LFPYKIAFLIRVVPGNIYSCNLNIRAGIIYFCATKIIS